MTAPTTTPFEPGFFQALARLHGHRCPMSILGAHLGLAARAALGAGPGQRLTAVYRHQTCALDGIQLATGCTAGNGNLQVHRRGEHRLLLCREGSASGVEAELTEHALARGQAYGGLRAEAEAAPPGTPERLRADVALEDLLRELEAAPAEELVSVRAASAGGGP
ncbi:MAG: formylmethanofuran dehydrogenase subunit E family protein [Thermodesulfobacteriota bacterium]